MFLRKFVAIALPMIFAGCQAEQYFEIDPYTNFVNEDGAYFIYKGTTKIDEMSGVGHIRERYKINELKVIDITRIENDIELRVRDSIKCDRVTYCEFGSGTSPVWLAMDNERYVISRSPPRAPVRTVSFDGGDGVDLMSVSCIHGLDSESDDANKFRTRAFWGFRRKNGEYYQEIAERDNSKCSRNEVEIFERLKNLPNGANTIKTEISDSRIVNGELRILLTNRLRSIGGMIGEYYICRGGDGRGGVCKTLILNHPDGYAFRPRFLGREGNWIIVDINITHNKYNVKIFDMQNNETITFRGFVEL